MNIASTNQSAVKIDPNTVEITTTNTSQIPLSDYLAELQDREAQLIAARDSYDPLIADVQVQIKNLQ